MKFNATIVNLYGIIVLIGGVIGFITASSLASLICGTLFGILLLQSGVLMYQGSQIFWIEAVCLTIVLALFFLYRYTKTLAFMPAGVMVLISTLVLIVLLLNRKVN